MDEGGEEEVQDSSRVDYLLYLTKLNLGDLAEGVQEKHADTPCVPNDQPERK